MHTYAHNNIYIPKYDIDIMSVHYVIYMATQDTFPTSIVKEELPFQGIQQKLIQCLLNTLTE